MEHSSYDVCSITVPQISLSQPSMAMGLIAVSCSHADMPTFTSL